MKEIGNDIVNLGVNGMIIAGMWALDDDPLTPSRMFWFGVVCLVLGAIVHVVGLVQENLRGGQ